MFFKMVINRKNYNGAIKKISVSGSFLKNTEKHARSENNPMEGILNTTEDKLNFLRQQRHPQS